MSQMVSEGALIRLLIEKGAFTKDEFLETEVGGAGDEEGLRSVGKDVNRFNFFGPIPAMEEQR